MSFRPKPPLGQRINWAHPLARGLVGCWLMTEGSGTKAYDLSGNNQTGVFQNSPEWNHKGIYFNRVDDDWIQVSSPNSIIDFGTGNYTIFTKVRLDGVSFARSILSFDNLDPVWLVNDTSITVYDGGWKADGDTVLAIGGVHSIGWVREGTGAGQLKYYLDGVPDGTSIHSESIGATSALGIGSSNGAAAGNIFDGVIYYVYIYNRALTPSEIQALHINPYAMFEDPYPIELFGYVAAGGGISIPVAMQQMNQFNGGQLTI